MVSVITLMFFGVTLTCIVVFLKKNENVYELIADHSSITLKNSKKIPWTDIDKIEAFSENPMLSRMRKRYLRLVLKNGERIILDASDYDIWYEDLKNDLMLLKTKNT